MRAMYSVLLYMSLAIALYSPNVSTLCGNDTQIEDLLSAVISQEYYYTAMSTMTGIQHTSGRIALRWKEIFEDMKSSLNKDHKAYRLCSDILERSTSTFDSSGAVISLLSMIPGGGFVVLPARLAESMTSVAILKQRLGFWKNAGCKNATTRDCNLWENHKIYYTM
ncbi:uncharacterized protein LOC115034593 [Acyrthosiphon pisum]|uniref:Uncharacterized protein n=1 Tax=Acyrthosiphon pisum TaxID=7029 RepID=A0A8R2NW90_ACYPI|nr:uncharacterized protein LOC115034587 isoform X2 [Acyrthosiphon pisum]XP_029347762.1 uncharacterized protein LOC115034593 [Acyrthosiphon pisum]